jgi:hypothetical protein
LDSSDLQRLPLISIRVRNLSHSLLVPTLLLPPRFSCHLNSSATSVLLPLGFQAMATNTKRQKRRDFVISSLNAVIEVSNLAKEVCSVTPAKAVFGSFSIILTMIKVGFFLRRLRRLTGG